MNLLRSILEDSTGGASTIRANAIVANAIALLIFTAVALTNCQAARATKTEAKVPEGLVIYCAAVVGLKVAQRVIEEKGNAT